MNIRIVIFVVGFLLTVLSLGFGYDLLTAKVEDIRGTRFSLELCVYGFVVGISMLLAGLGIVLKK